MWCIIIIIIIIIITKYNTGFLNAEVYSDVYLLAKNFDNTGQDILGTKHTELLNRNLI